MIRTKFKKKIKTMWLNRDCPPKGRSWVDDTGKFHQGLLRRYINKARRKGYQRIVFYSFRSDLTTIINLKRIKMRRTK